VTLRSLLVLLLLALAAPAPAHAQNPAAPLTIDDALDLAFRRNRDVIAAKLGVNAAEVERLAAGLRPNPVFSYLANNFSLGPGTVNCITQTDGNPVPGSCAAESFASNTVHSFAISWELDVWRKRNLRLDAAAVGVEAARAQVKDALRAVGAAVTAAWLKLHHAQEALALARQVRDQYIETVRVSRERARKGEIAGNEFQKIELEQQRYEAATIGAEQETADDERALKELLALPPETADFVLPEAQVPAVTTPELSPLVDEALAGRPDLQAVALQSKKARADLDVAHRGAWPNPSLALGYTRSQNRPAGDNENTLSLGLSVALPVFDRNQADIGRASVAVQATENALAKARLTVAHDVAEALQHERYTHAIVDTYVHREADAYNKQTNRLERAEGLLKAATEAYRIGAISLLELLEAQRTYNTTRSDYLIALGAYRQALADLATSVGRMGLYH
jgi:cobalt-zinc-cadmium efflux system outer membrane protein